MDLGYIGQLVLDGLVIGAIYALIAVGLSLIFGMLEIVNFAHGEFYMMGAMLAALTMATVGYWPTLVLAAIVLGVVGVIFFKLFLSNLKLRSFENSILLTLGVAMVLQNGAIYFFTATPRLVETEYEFASVSVGELRLPLTRLFALVTSIVSFALLYVVLYRTRIGQAMRAVAQNRDAALMVGIDPRSISLIAVMLSTSLAGVAGAALAPVYSVSPAIGSLIVFKAFAIVIIGGLGSLSGAAVVAIALGVAESLIGGLFSTVAKDGLAFVMMITVLLIRPHGLFGKSVRV